MTDTIAVIGLGYVGLPVAVALAKVFPKVIGFDISIRRIACLQDHLDWTGEIGTDELAQTSLVLTKEPLDISEATFYIVTVPTPIDDQLRPDLSPLAGACAIIGPTLKKGDVVVFESTVYPGVSEDFCGPLLEQHSGLTRGVDFKLGYSPERINPGDKEHRLESITKIISAEDAEAMDRLRDAYGAIIKAGLYEAESIKVAEAAKVLENTQRDINIALMNELAVILDRMNIRTKDVLNAAATKWNFLRFTPGLVGGHCIGVDPYYLTHCAEAVGYHPQVILAGRRMNDDMGKFIATKTVKLLVKHGLQVSSARVGVLGITFKENVPDLRNSKVPDIVTELQEYGIEPIVHDPLADASSAMAEYDITLLPLSAFKDLDAVILAVNHMDYVEFPENIFAMLAKKSVLIDVKSALPSNAIPDGILYWSL